MLRIERYTLLQDVRRSVRPSVALRYCVKTAKPIVEILTTPDSAIIRVFSELNRVLKFRRAKPRRGH